MAIRGVLEVLCDVYGHTHDVIPLHLKVEEEVATGSEESAVRTSGLVVRLITGRSKGDWQAGHCNTPRTSTAVGPSLVFFVGAAFPCCCFFFCF